MTYAPHDANNVCFGSRGSHTRAIRSIRVIGSIAFEFIKIIDNERFIPFLLTAANVISMRLKILYDQDKCCAS